MGRFEQLIITDGTTEVSLLRGEDGYYIFSWLPSIAQYKGGGTWQSSPFVDGRRLVQRQWDNTVETFDLMAGAAFQDELINFTQELRRLLERAVEYWVSDSQTTPVYIIAQASCETNPRYAIINAWSTPNDGNPFSQPFMNADGSAMVDITLNIERGHWLSAPPGTGECVEISGLGVGSIGEEAEPAANADDAFIVIQTSSIFDNEVLSIGQNASSEDAWTGIRFSNVAIPNGAVIERAFIRMTAVINAVSDCRFQIIGELSAAPAQYSTYANFRARVKTFASYVWDDVPTTAAGAKYDTIDITAIVQEIVNLGGWASGNDMAIQIWELGSDIGATRQFASFNNVTYGPPELNVVYESGEQVGRAATCEKEVYVANKHNKAQLTHIYRDDGGVWSANLVGDTAYALLPAVPVLHDAIYFGSDTTTDDSGPFCSLVFDVGAAKTGSAIWEYWNGAWTAFTNSEICDGTSPFDFNGDAFEVEGVNSVHWVQQSDWVTRDVSADGGPAVTGYWVRCRADAGGGGASTQQNREVYSVLWPYVTIAATEPTGDIPSIIEIKYEPKSKTSGANVTATTTPLWANKVLMALRSADRGADFSPYINLQDEQNPDGITITLATESVNAVDATTATGRHTIYSPAGLNDMQEEVRVIFTKEAALQYYGTYRMMIRGRQLGGALNTLYMQVEHKINTYSSLKWSSVRQFTSTTLDWQILDFGQWQLPGFSDVNNDEGVTGLELVINCESLSGTPGDIIFYELILWPIDEWAVETIDPSLDRIQGWVGGDRGDNKVWRYLSVDSLGYPRRALRTQSKVTDLDIRTVWRPIANGPAILQANKDQRLWALSLRNDDTGSLDEHQYHSEPYVGGTVTVEGVHRYLSMRGAR